MSLLIQSVDLSELPMHQRIAAVDDETRAPLPLRIWRIQSDLYVAPTTLGYVVYCAHFQYGFVGLPHDAPERQLYASNFVPSLAAGGYLEFEQALMSLLSRFYDTASASRLIKAVQIPLTA